jgi:hypothetical protein
MDLPSAVLTSKALSRVHLEFFARCQLLLFVLKKRFRAGLSQTSVVWIEKRAGHNEGSQLETMRRFRESGDTLLATVGAFIVATTSRSGQRTPERAKYLQRQVDCFSR